MNKPLLFMSKLGRYLNIFNKRSDNVNINLTVLRMLHALALLTFAAYVIPPAVQLALFLFRPKYYVDRMPTQVDGALLKMVYAYILYVSPQILISAAVLLMCSLLTAMVSKKTKSTAFQVIMSVTFYSCILYLLYKPFIVYMSLYARRSFLPKKALLVFAGCELLILFLIFVTRSSIYLSILFYNSWCIGKTIFSELFNIIFLKTPNDLASFAAASTFGSMAFKVENLLTLAGRTDIFEEIKHGIARKGYDTNKIFFYLDSAKSGCTYAFANSITDCILVSNAFVNAFAKNPKTITALLLHEIAHLENKDCIAAKILSFILYSGAIVIPLVWTIRKWKTRKTIENFLYAFILSRLWELILSIPICLYQVYFEYRADRALFGTGYEEHMIYFLTHYFFIAPPKLFGLNYDITAINWIYFTHPSNLQRIEQIKQNM